MNKKWVFTSVGKAIHPSADMGPVKSSQSLSEEGS